MSRTGRPAKIQGEDSTHPATIVRSDPTATLQEVRLEFQRRTGIDLHEQTIAKTLAHLGIRRVAGDRAVVVERNAPRPKRRGHSDVHRRQEPEQTYPSSLTDVEWALVRDLFENQGGRGLPPKVSRRLLVEA